ncbi:trypsin [Roseibium hamelinense]|uniref:Trypsin n=1 Tax=Roseibium hamelinense TaxID=150831 RepID=A0A562SU98_9HYPH|nr:cadherin-like domain-containing protein [Roseibium hamelinense]MTI42411.1 DUF4214 domain-containing protein [Roseibium hamelinense]TWI84703.1 trypsin [Roseibium hamelinense]
MSSTFDDDSYPGTAIVFIRVSWGSQTYVGTGFLVGRNDVLTASHVVYDERLGGLADTIEVIPSYDPYDNFNEPVYEPVYADYYTNFDPDNDGLIYTGDNRFSTQAGSEIDIALLSMDVALGDTYGWFGIDYNDAGGSVEVLGHPSVYDNRLTYDTGWANLDPVDDVFNIASNLEINGGNSGGPIYYTGANGPMAIGIVSTSAGATSIGGHSSWLADALIDNDQYLTGGNFAPQAVSDAYGTSYFSSITIGALAGVLSNDTDANNDTLSVQSHNYSGSGSVSVNSDGSFTYTPGSSFSGTDTFTYVVSDGNGGTDTGTVSITVAAPDAVELQIAQYYAHILLRSPTSTEMDNFSTLVDTGNTSLTGVRDTLAGSNEAVTYVDQVIRLYQSAFNRVPDAVGIDGWVDGMSAGTTDLFAASAGFTNSQEFLNLYGTNSVSEAYLAALYQNVLGRSHTSSEIAAWFATGQAAHEILIGFSNSQEFQNRSADAVLAIKKAAGDTSDLASVYDGTGPLLSASVARSSLEEVNLVDSEPVGSGHWQDGGIYADPIERIGIVDIVPVELI